MSPELRVRSLKMAAAPSSLPPPTPAGLHFVETGRAPARCRRGRGSPWMDWWAASPPGPAARAPGRGRSDPGNKRRVVDREMEACRDRVVGNGVLLFFFSHLILEHFN